MVFKCQRCLETFEGYATTVGSREMCLLCARRVLPKCERCSRVIQYKGVRVENLRFHLNCFVCIRCKKPVDSEYYIYETAGLFSTEEAMCTKCAKLILDIVPSRKRAHQNIRNSIQCAPVFFENPDSPVKSRLSHRDKGVPQHSTRRDSGSEFHEIPRDLEMTKFIEDGEAVNYGLTYQIIATQQENEVELMSDSKSWASPRPSFSKDLEIHEIDNFLESSEEEEYRYAIEDVPQDRLYSRHTTREEKLDREEEIDRHYSRHTTREEKSETDRPSRRTTREEKSEKEIDRHSRHTTRGSIHSSLKTKTDTFSSLIEYENPPSLYEANDSVYVPVRDYSTSLEFPKMKMRVSDDESMSTIEPEDYSYTLRDFDPNLTLTADEHPAERVFDLRRRELEETQLSYADREAALCRAEWDFRIRVEEFERQESSRVREIQQLQEQIRIFQSRRMDWERRKTSMTNREEVLHRREVEVSRREDEVTKREEEVIKRWEAIRKHEVERRDIRRMERRLDSGKMRHHERHEKREERHEKKDERHEKREERHEKREERHEKRDDGRLKRREERREGRKEERLERIKFSGGQAPSFWRNYIPIEQVLDQSTSPAPLPFSQYDPELPVGNTRPRGSFVEDPPVGQYPPHALPQKHKEVYISQPLERRLSTNFFRRRQIQYATPVEAAYAYRRPKDLYNDYRPVQHDVEEFRYGRGGNRLHLPEYCYLRDSQDGARYWKPSSIET